MSSLGVVSANCHVNFTLNTEENLDKAWGLFKKASNKGYPPTLYDLAMENLPGGAIKTDLEVAKGCLEIATDQGFKKQSIIWRRWSQRFKLLCLNL